MIQVGCEFRNLCKFTIQLPRKIMLLATFLVVFLRMLRRHGKMRCGHLEVILNFHACEYNSIFDSIGTFTVGQPRSNFDPNLMPNFAS